MNGDKQTLEEFFDSLCFSLASSITYSVNCATRYKRNLPKSINFYGVSEDFLFLISNRVKQQLGSERGISNGIPHIFHQSITEKEAYHIDVGWFFSVYNKNGKVNFSNQEYL